MSENPDTPASRPPTAENHEPHLAENADRPAASSSSNEQQREDQTNEWPRDIDDWDDDELDEDRDRCEAPDGWDEDEPDHAERPADEGDSSWSFGSL